MKLLEFLFLPWHGFRGECLFFIYAYNIWKPSEEKAECFSSLFKQINVFCCCVIHQWKLKRISTKSDCYWGIRHLHNSFDSQPLLSLSHYFLPASYNFIWLDNQYKIHISEEYFSLCIAKYREKNTFWNDKIGYKKEISLCKFLLVILRALVHC